jgi:aspartate ammonia-lyase
MTSVRIEHDLLGDREVPAAAYYGVHTLRAQENFRITGITIATFPELIVALASVKQAAAEANTELGLLAPALRDAIVAACKEIRGGALHDQFVVDVIQGGAGTSTNMNANEVICNRALELMGHRRGEYQHLHPNEHVNMAQSTNDVYPTAIRIATCFAIERLLRAMEHLRAAFAAKSVEFAGLMKIGRTQLQERCR